MPSRAGMRASPRLVGNAWKSCRGVYGASSRASSSVVSWMSREATHESLAADSYEPIIGARAMLLAANEAAGTIRPGLDPDDVLLMMGFLWPIDPRATGGPARIKRSRHTFSVAAVIGRPGSGVVPI